MIQDKHQVWRVAVDTGGTFTDCIFLNQDGRVRRGKVLSNAALRLVVTATLEQTIVAAGLPSSAAQLVVGCPVFLKAHLLGVVEAVRGDSIVLDRTAVGVPVGAIVEIRTGLEAPVLALHLFLGDALAQGARIGMRLGTTKGTNALLEGKGAKVALFLTAGFADLLRIGDQKRPHLFARAIPHRKQLYHGVFAVGGRMSADGSVLNPLDEEGLRKSARLALASGCTAAAVCFLHGWRNPEHEIRAGEILQEFPFNDVHLASQLTPGIHYGRRAQSVLVNATLESVLSLYLNEVCASLGNEPLQVMTSSGGLVDRKQFCALDSLVSGPAGGVKGAVAVARACGLERMISLDMGGTSTDVCRWNGEFELRSSVTVGDYTVFSPALRIETVAAGGGSVCEWNVNGLQVGPRSAGAQPGPASYGGGGPLTVTDLHLLLGRIDRQRFGVPLDMSAARAAMTALTDATGGAQHWTEIACGLLRLASEKMAQAIREVTAREGEDPARYALIVFGGAGGLHACDIAAKLAIPTILFPADAGLLSARGILASVPEVIVEQQLLIPAEDCESEIKDVFAALVQEARRRLGDAGGAVPSLAAPLRTVELRMKGQESTLSVHWEGSLQLALTAFRSRFRTIFGYHPTSAAIELVSAKVRLGESTQIAEKEVFANENRLFPSRCSEQANTTGDEVPGTRDAWVGGSWRKIPVLLREGLAAGDWIEGPALVSDRYGTLFVEPGWQLTCGTGGTVRLQVLKTADLAEGAGAEDGAGVVGQALLRHRLESIVSEMGTQLQRTALSTNIRERLDFSCGLLDAEGRLVLNAPHVPVHLGALGECVRSVLTRHRFAPGDVLITNHPAYGGSHLPDITVICGLFDLQGQLLGYLANRAHHAEIGGIMPGSMPVGATTLIDEGVVIHPQWLIRNGAGHFDAIERLLRAAPYPSRSPRENRIDLEAQAAALQRGQHLFAELLYSTPATALLEFFTLLRSSSRAALLRKLAAMGSISGQFEQRLDDNTAIRCQYTLADTGAVFDFTGTDERHPGNLNATSAIVRSVLLYVLRVWLDEDLPLNEGLLEDVRVVLPPCLLNPGFSEDPALCPAVVGGNTETSQQLADALLRSLGIMAGGQATMNNFLFGDERFGYYETIGGGAAAGPGFPGASGVHVHMTNTAITDPELLELRYPIRCHQFALRPHSGGPGKWCGGDGLIREFEFLKPLQVSMLSQNRSKCAPGVDGGQPGAAGRQILLSGEGDAAQELPPTVSLSVQTGDRIRIETPGGGGWGA